MDLSNYKIWLNDYSNIIKHLIGRANNSIGFAHEFPSDQIFMVEDYAGFQVDTGSLFFSKDRKKAAFLVSDITIDTERTGPTKTSRGDNIHFSYSRWHSGSGKLASYCNFAKDHVFGYGNALVLLAPFDENILKRLDWSNGYENLIAHNGTIVSLSADIPDPSRYQSEVQKLLSQRNVLIGEARIPAFVRNDKKLRLYQRMINERYKDYELWKKRYLERLNKTLPQRKDLVQQTINLRALLRSLRSRLTQVAPEKFSEHRKSALWSLAAKEARVREQSKASSNTGSWIERIYAKCVPTHDRTAQRDSQSGDVIVPTSTVVAIIKEWETSMPQEIQDVIDAEILSEITPKYQKLDIPGATSSNNPDAVTSKLIASLNKDFDAMRSDADRSRSIQEKIKEFCDAHDEAFSKLIEIERKTPAPTRWLYSEKFSSFRNFARRHLTFADLVVQVWKPKRPKGMDTKSLPFECPNPVRYRFKDTNELKNMDNNHPWMVGMGDHYFKFQVSSSEFCKFTNFGVVPAISLKSFAAPSVALNHKLQPKFSDTAAVYAMFDSAQQMYNPALGRSTSWKRAVFDRPSLVGLGLDTVKESLKSFGYAFSVDPAINTIVQRRKARSDRNRTPSRPIQAFEAPGYYDYGKMAAQGTLLDPTTGNPIWIAGKEYLITPGWTRKSRTTNTEDMVTQTIDGMRDVREITTLDIGVTTWTIEAEGGQTISIEEDQTREDAELERSGIIHPELLDAALAATGRTRLQTASNDASRINVTALTDLDEEDSAFLEFLNQAINTPGATQPNPDKNKKEDPWPTWTVSFEDFVTVFPPPIPPDASIVFREQIDQNMQRILQRFGPKYSLNPSLTATEEVEDKAIALWLADQKV